MAKIDLRVAGTLVTPVVVTLVANLFCTKICLASVASAVHPLSDLLVHQILAAGPARDRKARFTPPPPYNWFNFTLLTNLFFALAPLCLFPFHTII